MAIKKKGLQGALNKLTYDKPELDKRAIQVKKSLDEVTQILNGKGKDTK